jgi:hypothetical protein
MHARIKFHAYSDIKVYTEKVSRMARKTGADREVGRRDWGRSGDPRAWLRWGIEREGGELGGGLTSGGE